ncbi:hypothetical protein PSPO01_16469 [Paraphaeosphaeria sporulosa]
MRSQLSNDISQTLSQSSNDDSHLPLSSDDDLQGRALFPSRDGDSQPIAKQNNITSSPISDITFGSISDTSERNHSLLDDDQQRDDARPDQVSGANPHSKPPLNYSNYPAQRVVLQRDPELRVPFSQNVTKYT